MAEINDIFQATEDRIDTLLKTNDANIVKSIKKLEKKILNLYQSEYPQGKAKFKLAQAVRVHKNMIKLMNTEYNVAMNTITSEYSKVISAISSEFAALDLPFGFTKVDDKIFAELQATAFNSFKQLGNKALNDLSQSLYNGVALGSDFAAIAAEMRAALVGLESVTGVSLATHAQRYAHDSLMDYYAAVQKRKSAEAGLNHYLYMGNIQFNTRPFCAARAGLVFTEAQIDSWNLMSWRGQSGDVWTSRGGFKCRHSFHAVAPEWIEDGRIEAQSVFDEDPSLMTPKNAAAVEKEKAKMYG